MKKTIGYGIIGGAIGAAVTIITMPSRLAFAVTAPASYPIIGFMSAVHSFSLLGKNADVPFATRALAPLGGLAFGTALIPMAPLVVLSEPLQVPVGFIEGAVIGGYLGYQADNGAEVLETIQEAIEEIEEAFGD